MGFQREMMFVVQFVMRWGVVMLVMQICLAMRITGQQTDTRATSRVTGPAGVVTVPGGRIRGQRVRLTNRHLSAVDQYLGVPYARPPTGHLRFRPPQSPPVSWTEVRNATKLSPACPQVVRTAEADMPRWKSEPLRHRWPYLQVMDEDCLFLNVYVPTKGEHNSVDPEGTDGSTSLAGDSPPVTDVESTAGFSASEVSSETDPSQGSEPPSDQPSFGPPEGDRVAEEPLGDEPREDQRFPVMVFIHGDGYQDGSGNMYDGSVLASYGDVIVVTFNYRLGILGFLSTDDGAARGNYGLLDQILVLKWINQNIENFGGDPGRVTIFGVGSGAASAGLLMLSNMTTGLMSGVIAHSGSAIAPWAISREPRKFAKMAATEIGCEASTTYKMVDCLREVRAEEFQLYDIEAPLYYNAFAPVVDGALIEDEPSVLLEKLANGERKPGCDGCSYMSGVTRSEGFHYVGEDADGVGRLAPEDFNHILDGFVQNNYGSNMHAGNVIKKAIYYEYIDWGGGEGNPYTLIESAIEIISDDLWATPAIKSLKLADKSGINAYFFTFGHRSKMDVHPRWAGAVHLSDMPFVFGAPLVPGPLGIFKENYTKGDATVSLAIMTYWSNFAKTGNPNIPEPQTASKIHRQYQINFPYQALDEWPKYDDDTQQFLHIGVSPRIRDFYRLHKVSFWEELVPEISRAFPADLIPVPSGDTTREDTPTAATSFEMLITSITPAVTSEMTEDNVIRDVIPTTPIGTPAPMGNEIPVGPVTQNEPNFKVELSVVIAVGGFLLLLNILVLGTIYYMRDRRKLESKLAAKYLAQQEERKRQQKMSGGAGSRLASANNHDTASPAHHGINHNVNRNSVTFGNDGVIEFQV